jgi:hypothetical protein
MPHVDLIFDEIEILSIVIFNALKCLLKIYTDFSPRLHPMKYKIDTVNEDSKNII